MFWFCMAIDWRVSYYNLLLSSHLFPPSSNKEKHSLTNRLNTIERNQSIPGRLGLHDAQFMNVALPIIEKYYNNIHRNIRLLIVDMVYYGECAHKQTGNLSAKIHK